MNLKNILNSIKQKLQEKWPFIRSWLYRWIRGAFSVALADTLFLACKQGTDTFNALQCALNFQEQWTDPQKAATTLSIAFVSGFLLALGKAIRDQFGDLSRKDSPSLLDRVLPL